MQFTLANGEKVWKEIKQKVKTIPVLPDVLECKLLTDEDIAHMKKKAGYPVPFPLFCAMWPLPHVVMLGGGGGTPGMGVPSGMIMCDAMVETDVEKLKKLATDDDGWRVEPYGDLQSNDLICMAAVQHPTRAKEIVAAIGSSLVSFTLTGKRLVHTSSTQADWHADRELSHVSAVCVSPNGDLVVTGGEDREIRLWRYPVKRGAEPLASLGTTDKPASCVAMNRDGTLVAACCCKSKVQVWRVPLKNELPSASVRQGLVTLESKGSKGGLTMFSCRFMWDKVRQKEFLVVIASDPHKVAGYALKYQVPGFKLHKKKKLMNDMIIRLETSADHSMFVVATGGTKSVAIYKTSDLSLVCAKAKCHSEPCSALAFSPDQRTVLSLGGADRSMAFIPIIAQKGLLSSFLLVMLHAVVVSFLFVLCRVLR